MSKLKYYYDLLSQPSRAVYMFLKLNKIPFEEHPMNLREGEHRKEDFRKINPFQLVPVIDDNGFIVTESVAILQYLCKKYNLPDHWYPQNDIQSQTRVNQYLNWQHVNTRLQGVMIFQNMLFRPQLMKKPVDWEKVYNFKSRMKRVIEHIDKDFLKEKPYLCGDDISIADLLGVCELMQLNGVHEESMYESNPNVKAWVDRVEVRLSPEFEPAHQAVYRVRDMYKTAAARLAKL